MKNIPFHPLADIFPLIQEREFVEQKAREIAEHGAVYFIRDDDRAAVKIGWSKDPLRRLSQLQTGCCTRLRIVGVAAGTRDLESGFHSLFSDVRGVGEWFSDANMEVSSVVSGLKNEGLM